MKCCGGGNHNHDGEHKSRHINFCMIFMIIAVIILIITYFSK